ncbi:hypothetical protein [Pseudomarimonas salicorniae]|uniref:Uncharacterized protein n=1 Tax=Pseudomarimonas salicorniae TaxID=2933270 RepID=A0ABT0GLM2_9GAMM|nr:hypothetical protein [Lysobacter sp. CAU 1642]MCK7595318.1 hypothetical protein [Lysobacter sp. CAU 1642]
MNMSALHVRSVLALCLVSALAAPVAAEVGDGASVLGRFDEAAQRFDRAQLAKVLAADARISVVTCSAPEDVSSGEEFIASTVSMAPAIKTYVRSREAISREDGVGQGAMILRSRVHEAIEAQGGYSKQGWSSERTTLAERGGRLVITAIESKMDCS